MAQLIATECQALAAELIEMRRALHAIPEIGESCYSHMLVFAAEKARKEQCVVDVEQFIGDVEG